MWAPGASTERHDQQSIPLEVNTWADRAFGLEVHDHYGQTEAGMLINNHQFPTLRRPVRPGSMGHPMPGWSLDVLYAGRDEIAPVGTVGRIAADLSASALAWFAATTAIPARARRSSVRTAAGITRVMSAGWTTRATPTSRPGTTTSSSWPDTASVRRKSRRW
ncbi:AMP-binding protein [Streptomyces sp. NPDC050546]|uniref:AMP-binding protein n=1 Tax=Streptomyces sp. NPDC050546 TaxID=3365628 RepID=UPI0037B50AF3